ncbi:hypothetical protein BDW68DRAFT_169202 [Aspergillus falconensis]
MSLPKTPKHWTRQSFLISTDKSLLSLSAINAAFASEPLYWAYPLPESVLQDMIDKSFCFGLYKTPSPSPSLLPSSPSSTNNVPENESEWSQVQQIGFARLITDTCTIAYLSDVYILPKYQGLGLGGWLLDCVDDLVRPLPHLRWFLLRTGEERSLDAYRARFGMEVLDNGDLSRGALFMGRRGGGNRV